MYVEQVDDPGRQGRADALLGGRPAGNHQGAARHSDVAEDDRHVINGAHDVTLRHFTITGPGGGPCDSLEYGVRIDNNGSALITDNHITQIRDTPFSGCQNGVGVLVGRNCTNTLGTGTGRAQPDRQLPEGRSRGRRQPIDGAERNAEVAFNEISGIGPTACRSRRTASSQPRRHRERRTTTVSRQHLQPGVDAPARDPPFAGGSAQSRSTATASTGTSDGIGLYTTREHRGRLEPLARQRPVRRSVRRQRHRRTTLIEHNNAHEEHRVRLRRHLHRAVNGSRRGESRDPGSRLHREPPEPLQGTPRT